MRQQAHNLGSTCLSAARLFPGGSNGEFGLPEPIVLERGAGCRVWDTDGREYLDMSMAWGSALVGHVHPKVVEAAMRQAALGANFAAVNARSVELAERLCDIVPFLERVRFVASGTEATMMCLRVARAATGRPKILKFEGAYHGQNPEGVTSLVGDATNEFPRSDASGTGAPWVERDVLVAPFNDFVTAMAIIEEHGDDIAAIIVEPLHRCIPPMPGFLKGLWRLTRRHGIVLVYDEVVTGFRLGPNGARYDGVDPDLVAYGKALGGGFPIGAFGGRADLMEVVNEARLPGPNYVWSASTTGGNPVSCAAALATLDVLSEPGVYRDLIADGKLLRTTIEQAMFVNGVEGVALGDGPLGQAAFGPRPVTDHRTWLATDRAFGRRVMLALMERGVWLNPMGTKLYLSIAHDEAAIAEFGDKFADSLNEVTRLR